MHKPDAPEHRRSRTDPRRRFPQRTPQRDRHGRADLEATTCEWTYLRSRPAYSIVAVLRSTALRRVVTNALVRHLAAQVPPKRLPG
jgi:hypothetical protein